MELKSFKKNFLFLLSIIIIGQLIFISFSGKYKEPKYESKIYTTIGFGYQAGDDLNRLNEAAHNFGQTISGWTKFPDFEPNLKKYAGLPSDIEINMHMQERQNFIFTITTKKAPITLDQTKKVKDFLQTQLNDFNSKTKTNFILVNSQYQQITTVKSLKSGMLITLLLSLVVSFGILFLKKEFFKG